MEIPELNGELSRRELSTVRFDYHMVFCEFASIGVCSSIEIPQFIAILISFQATSYKPQTLGVLYDQTNPFS